MSRTRLVDASSIVAALGPTNTGKTHRAVERMLEHESGMIGLPLRLLAREVYDRVSARIGEERVALVTGEEKRVPARPAYWVSTVEAMPIDREVDFLAVDEIQLCAHQERGHVFTERLLSARGRLETWFLGAETMRPMIETLVPAASQRRFERFSDLRHVPQRSLRSLPPRTAVVAFSVEQVYELAERLRSLRGGVAVVLGALSPRTRNAQVAMYQAGEVGYLVATDAIGMGLNLDVDHVAFAALRKFDGREHRTLEAAELAQIAGRAGRHLNDGTFGTVRPLPELSPRVVTSIEEHRFPPVTRVVWRNGDLDFSSLDALVESLERAPSHPALRRVDRADDHDALRQLATLDEVRSLARGEDAVSLLWEVCQIPDFRKLLLNRHVPLLLEIYRQLMRADGRLDDAWLDAQLRRVDDTTGSIDALTARLSAVRTWTYVSYRGAWLRDHREWQERASSIEDALGDALHRALVERFVERAGRSVKRRFKPRNAPPDQPAPPASGPFAQLRSLAIASSEDEPLTEDAFVERIVGAPHDELHVDRLGRVSFEGERIARLVRGKDLLAPEIALEEPEAWSGGSRARLERRLRAFTRDLVSDAMGGFRPEIFRVDRWPADVRGLAYRLERGLGVVRMEDASAQWGALAPHVKNELTDRGVRAGKRVMYVEGALSPTALERRRVLAVTWRGDAIDPDVPSAPSVRANVFAGPDDARTFGYEIVGRVAIRADVLEKRARRKRRRRRGRKRA